MSEAKKRKKPVLIVIIVIVAALIVAAAALIFTGSSRSNGVWVSDTQYLQSKGCDVHNVLIIDGSRALRVMLDSSDSILDMKVGTLDKSLFRMEMSVSGETGRTVFHYNPIFGKLKTGIWTYSKSNAYRELMSYLH